MPEPGITSGGRHIWVNGRHGLIRKPLNNVRYYNDPLPVPEKPRDFERVPENTKKIPESLPWWKRLLKWIKQSFF